MHVIETYRIAHDYDRALSESAKFVDEFPESRSLALLRATVLAETGDIAAGVKLLEKQLRGNAGDREIYLRLSEVYQKGKKFDQALEAIAKAQELASSESDRLNVLFAHGSVLERAKRFEEAEKKFRELLQADPDNSSALNYLGYMLADMDVRLDEAHDMIQRALDMEPENGAYLDSLGWLYYRQDKLELAERYLQRSLKQFGGDPTVLSHLGDVYHKQGKLEKAVDYWKRSLDEWEKNAPADKDRTEMEEIRKKLSESKLPLSSQAQQAEKKANEKKR